MMFCDACLIEDSKLGKENLINLQIRHINGTPVILCKSCRAIWYDIRYGIIKRYGTLSNSKKSREETERVYKIFRASRGEVKVLLT